jgi:hypothetical protein
VQHAHRLLDEIPFIQVVDPHAQHGRFGRETRDN